ncbi:sulfatase family protein [Petrotoga halophila]|uniref:sulfatase family protein n=1 Tax=Petrotoga halophila TaxID=301141 RepID=UPI0031841C46
MVPSALEWLNKNAESDNWFLHVNVWDPHTPYRTPSDFGDPFENSPIPGWYNEELIKRHRKLAGPHTAQDLNMYDNREDPRFPRQPGEIKNMNDLKQLIDGYDTGIRYADFWIGKIIDMLKEKRVYENTAVIISADHGENIGELGIYAEHATADNITSRIPLIIKWPGGLKSHVHQGFLYNLDLISTLYEIFESEIKSKFSEEYIQMFKKEMDGISFADVIFKGEKISRKYLILSQMAHVCQRSVRFDDWIYMRSYHDGYHLFPKEMLFNLKEDPHERNDIAKESPEICREALSYLNEWHDEMMKELPEGYQVDPLQTVLKEGGPYHARGHLKTYYERLKETGREKAAEELKRKYPAEF